MLKTYGLEALACCICFACGCGSGVEPGDESGLSFHLLAPAPVSSIDDLLGVTYAASGGGAAQTVRSSEFVRNGPTTRVSRIYPTDSDGTLEVVLSIVAGDTVGRLEMSLELDPGRTWVISMSVGARTFPCSMCTVPVAYPLSRHLEGASVDSFFVSTAKIRAEYY